MIFLGFELFLFGGGGCLGVYFIRICRSFVLYVLCAGEVLGFGFFCLDFLVELSLFYLER